MINHVIHTGAKLHIRQLSAKKAVHSVWDKISCKRWGRLFYTAALFVFTAMLLFSACKPVDKEKSNAVSRRKMVEILVDIHLQEARADAMHISRDSILPEMKLVHDEILAKHKVTQTDFKKTMDYYLQNPQQLDAMYQDVVDELSRQEALSTGKQEDKNKK